MRPRTTSHNYIPKAVAFLQSRGLPAVLNLLQIEHDGWCDLVNNRGFCNCDTTFAVLEMPCTDPGRGCKQSAGEN